MVRRAGICSIVLEIIELLELKGGGPHNLGSVLPVLTELLVLSYLEVKRSWLRFVVS